MEVIVKKIQKVIKDKRGMSYPLTVSLVIALLILLCVMAEFFRLNVIAYGVRESLQASVISVATTNYNEVYDGIREGYSGGYAMNGSGWEQNLDYGDVYNSLDGILGTCAFSFRYCSADSRYSASSPVLSSVIGLMSTAIPAIVNPSS